jgi:hypothetical protein
MRVEIKPATQKGKKWKAIFYEDDGKKLETIPFGQAGSSDFTQHRDKARKERYIKRHEAREDWTNPRTAGALSRWILWNLPSFKSSLADFKKRFNLK